MDNSGALVVVMLLLVVLAAGAALMFYQKAQDAQLQAAMLQASLKAEQNRGGVSNVFTGIAKMFSGKW